MYNNFTPAVFGGHGHSCRCHKCGPCKEFNFYKWNPPIQKNMLRMDATLLTIHTNEFIRPDCEIVCCKPVPVKKIEESSSFIITAETECLKPGYEYTLDIDHDVPFEVSGLPTFIRPIPCDFRKGPVRFNKTKTIFKACYGEDGAFTGYEFDGYGDKCGFATPIPDDPSNPGDGFVDGCHHGKCNELIPVKLDLKGSLCTGENFFTGRYKIPGTGKPYSNKFVVFLNNAGEFVLCRDWRRRSDYA